MRRAELDHDAWTRWRSRVQAGRSALGLTYVDVAERVNAELDAFGPHSDPVSAHDIKNWFMGKSTPPLGVLKVIARSLGIDPMEALAELGLLDENYQRVALDLVAARQRLTQMERERSRYASPVAAAVDAALEANVAVGVWPAQEGQKTGALRVANRITFLSELGQPVPSALGDVLAQHGAVMPIASALRDMQLFAPAPEFLNGRSMEVWSMPLLTLSRPPGRVRTPSAPSSIFAFSLCLTAGPTDVAALLADSLGRGFNATRELRSLMFAGRYDPAEMSRQRNVAARYILAPSQAPLRRNYVWSHYGPVDLGSDGKPINSRHPVMSLGVETSDTVVVWLRETTQLLEEHVQSTDARFSVEQLLEMQAGLAAWAAGRSDVVEMSVSPVPAGGRGSQSRHEKIDRSIDVVAELIEVFGRRAGSDLTQEVLDQPDAPAAVQLRLGGKRHG